MTRARHPKQFCPSRGSWEASWRHLRSIWEPSRRHLGGSGGQGGLKGILWQGVVSLRCGMQKVSSYCNFATFFEGDINYHRVSTATYAERQCGRNKEHIKTPGQRDVCLGNEKPAHICDPSERPRTPFCLPSYNWALRGLLVLLGVMLHIQTLQECHFSFWSTLPGSIQRKFRGGPPRPNLLCRYKIDTTMYTY